MQNVGTVDKFIRIALGVVLLSQVYFGLQTAWGWLGVIFLATGFINFCPIYKVLGWHTNDTQSRA